MSLLDLPPHAWVVLAAGAVLVGFAKTAVGGVGALAVVAFAAVLPAKESTGALLPLLCVGDLIAVRVYHRHADWHVLLTLLPGVVPGMAVGAWFLSVADDTLMRRAIGATLVAMVVIQLSMRRSRMSPAADEDPLNTRILDAQPAASPASGTPSEPTPAAGTPRAPLARNARAHRPPSGSRPVWTGLTGIAAGFATMTANAAGAVTSLYMILAGLPMRVFLGTAAWFYLIVNAAKAPVSASLGFISPDTLALNAVLVPPLLAGAVAGVWTINRINQDLFERVVMLATAVGAVALFA
ncbi:sulfite exporter TauE/SafE family protein [Nocardioides sp.]|uniref:sulfite exporter TauE/SafE family protein n=1 Tax=Nocardioides sp. TaxID=35761 RepID=UPI0035ADDC85